MKKSTKKKIIIGSALLGVGIIAVVMLRKRQKSWNIFDALETISNQLPVNQGNISYQPTIPDPNPKGTILFR
jgi:hypothetical protein